MFFWNCWMRNRFRLVAYLVLGCALMLLATLPVTMKFVHGHWIWVHPGTAADAMDAWRFGTEHAALVLILAMLFSAADLGSLGLGESAARKEYDFLLTRPRNRRHFVWAAYVAGLAQMCLLGLIFLVVAVTTLYGLTSRLHAHRLGLLSLAAFVLIVLVFSGAFALSVGTGNTRTGFELAFCLLVFYYSVLQVNWHIGPWLFNHHKARMVDMSLVYAGGAYDWLLNEQTVNYSVLLLMLAATVLLAFLAQFAFERKDL